MEYQTDLDRVRLVRERSTTLERNKLTKSGDVQSYFRNIYKQNNDDISVTESFYMLMVAQDLTVLGWAKISEGGISATLVDIRVVANYALGSLCTSVFFCHNHPSGNPKPSETDKALTNKLVSGLGLIDVRVMDHVIITEDGYVSFVDEGLL